MAAHAALGASGAHRWFECPGSLSLFPDMESESSVYAREGNAAHWIAATALIEAKNAIEYLKVIVPDYEDIKVDEEMCGAVQQYLDAVRRVIHTYEDAGYTDAELSVEVRFDLTHIYPDMFGTCDATVYLPASRTLCVFDYKHGFRGVIAERNKQTMYYGLGALTGKHNRGIQNIVLTIVQPRSIGDKTVKEWKCTPETMLDFCADLVEAAERTKAEKLTLKAGSWCGYCAKAPECPVIRDYIGEILMATFVNDKMHIINPEKLTPDKMRTVYDNIDVINQWVKNFKAYALAQTREGKGPKGMRVVEGQSHRKWVDINKAEAGLNMLAEAGLISGEILTTPELKSPAQIEALCKDNKDLIKPLWVKPPGYLTLVPDNDERSTAKASVDNEFSAAVALL